MCAYMSRIANALGTAKRSFAVVLLTEWSIYSKVLSCSQTLRVCPRNSAHQSIASGVPLPGTLSYKEEKSMWQRVKRFNDDAWKTSCLVSFLFCLACLYRAPISATVVVGFGVGVLYQEFIEWYGHLLQHRASSKVLRYFRVRHGRHHTYPEAPHALQPLIAVVVAFPAMLAPALWCMASGFGTASALGYGVVSGFFFAYGTLCVLHYDVHAERKIVPAFIRSTIYYQRVETRHVAHHSQARFYCVSNPWLDDLMTWTGADRVLTGVGQKIFRIIDAVFSLVLFWRRSQ